MPDLNFEQNINQSLQMMLSPRMLSMLRVLHLPYTELVTEIEAASEENPFIEIEQHERLTEYLRFIDSHRKQRKEVDFREYPGLENVKEKAKSLKTMLIGQLGLLELSKNETGIAEALIDEIDGQGYLKNYEEVQAQISAEFNASREDIDKVLTEIQTLEPEGVLARNVKECLLIQLKTFGLDNEELEEVIKKAISSHLEDLSNKEFKKAAQSLRITEDGVKEILNFIQTNLNPYPASAYGEEEHLIVPSFTFEKHEGKYKVINLEEKYGPKVVLSKEYQRMMKDPKIDAETVKFLKERFEKAKEMLDNLSRREVTSEAIMEIILETQKDFLEKGASHLLPLEQQELAQKLGLHPSTVSRAIAHKYVQTPKGLIPVKYLCQRQLKGSSPVQIKAKIKYIITNEAHDKPLQDEEIRVKLQEEGIRIGRRTVASYRKALGFKTYEDRGQ